MEAPSKEETKRAFRKPRHSKENSQTTAADMELNIDQKEAS
jgi:hypothetical protein